MKYIIIDEGTLEYPVIFSEFCGHDEYAKGKRVVAAGFVNFYIENNKIYVHTYGKSMSLNIESRKQDGKIIEKHLELKYLGKKWKYDLA
jgi:hypothetical protein